MEQLILHAGAIEATYEEIKNVPLPIKTESYVPLPHGEYFDMVYNLTSKLIGAPGTPKFSLSHEGNRLFGILPVINHLTEQHEFCVGFRNSYDKSMKAGLCFGNHVFVCDNLAFSGKVVVLRKHTGDILEDIQSRLVNKLLKADEEISIMQSNIIRMQGIAMGKTEMARFLGEMVYGKCINMADMKKILTEMDESQHFHGNTAWDLYNHGTRALADTPFHKKIERLTQWNDCIVNLCG